MKKNIYVNFFGITRPLNNISLSYKKLKQKLDEFDDELKEYDNKIIEVTLTIKELIDLYFSFIAVANNDFDSVVNVQAIRMLKNKFNFLEIYNFDICDKNILTDETTLYLSPSNALSFNFSLKMTLENLNKNKNYNYSSLLRKLKSSIETNNTFIKYNNIVYEKSYGEAYMSRLLNLHIIIDDQVENNTYFSVDDEIYSFNQETNFNDFELTKDDIIFLKESLKQKNRLVELNSKKDIPLLMVMCERILNKNTAKLTDDCIIKITNQLSKLEFIEKMKKKKRNTEFIYKNKLKLTEEKLKELKKKKLSLVERMEIKILSQNDIDKLYKSLRTKNQKEAFIQAYYNLLYEDNLQKYLETEDILFKDLPFSIIPEVNVGILKLSNNNGLPTMRN